MFCLPRSVISADVDPKENHVVAMRFADDPHGGVEENHHCQWPSPESASVFQSGELTLMRPITPDSFGTPLMSFWVSDELS